MTPGASLVVILRHTWRHGRGTGVAAAWAHATGIAVYAGAAVTGLAAWLAHYPATARAITVVGALYLGWLGIGAIRTARAADRGQGGAESRPSRSALRDGFLTALFNPKVAGFFLALFSQFVDAGQSGHQQLLLAATAVGVDGGWYSLVAFVAGRPAWQYVFERYAARLELVSGGVLLALAGAGLVRAALAS